MEFTEEQFDRFREDLNNAVMEVANKYDVDITFGSFRYALAEFNTKMTVKRRDVDAERVNWVLNCERYDLHPDHYNQTFEDEGDWFQIVGLDTSKKRYPILALHMKTGDIIRFNPRYVEHALNTQKKR